VTPRRLRVYANRANIIDFSEVEDVQPSLNISLLESETGVTEYPLRMAAFSSITSLSLFFSDSVGEESTRIYYIGFKGETRTVRKEGSNKLEIPAANAPDASLTDRLRERGEYHCRHTSSDRRRVVIADFGSSSIASPNSDLGNDPNDTVMFPVVRDCTLWVFGSKGPGLNVIWGGGVNW